MAAETRVTSQGTPRIAGNTRSQQKAISPSESPEGTSPTDTLILDFRPLKCEKIHSCCFKPPSLQQVVMAALGNEYSLKKEKRC